MKKLITRTLKFIFTREMIAYLIAGGLTTVINLFAYYIFYNEMKIPNLSANALAWVIAVLFAFAVNDRFVFNGKGKKNKLWKRFYQFILARLASLLVDEAGMYLMVEVFLVHNMVSKAAMNVVVILMNYALSKWIIFGEKRDMENMEIEKKYRLKYLPDNLNEYPKRVIEQGYLCTNPVVRIRKSNEDYILTYKSRFEAAGKKDQSAAMCKEIEAPLTKEAYEHLKKKIDWNLIEKTRYFIPINETHTAELDIFGGKLKGLVFAEVEFDSEKEADAFVPPEWFGKDVTHDACYQNNNLAKVDSFLEIEYN